MARCRSGAYAVEFAVLAPVVIPVLMGTVEMAWQFGASVALDHAALEASRYASLGRDNGDGTRSGSSCPADIKKAAIEAARGFLVADRLDLFPKQYKNLVGMGDPANGTSGTGVGGSFLEYRLEYRQPVLAAGKLFGKSEVTHVAATVIMNEPFPDAAKPKAC